MLSQETALKNCQKIEGKGIKVQQFAKKCKGDKDTIKESFDRFKGTKTKSKQRTDKSLKKKYTN